jgi:hypothetical protein
MELSSSSSIPCRSYNSMRLISKRIENEYKKSGEEYLVEVMRV